MQELIKKLRKQLYSKPAPGEVLNNITEKKLQELAKNYQHDEESLWIGAYIADLFITEAKDKGKISEHVPMAVAYAKEVIAENNIDLRKAEIVLEIIETHHGGQQKYIESKLYKNADCFKFLDPKGVFHIFGAFYKGDEKSFKDAIEYTMYKLEEKYRLVDLDDALKQEANELYEKWKAIFDVMEYKLETPELYK